MFLSFIIPVYNVEKYVAECLDSLLDQDIPQEDYEILCINDGSTDGSLAILREYEAKYANIRVIDKENGGVSSARNVGIEAAKGDYVWMADSDDLIAHHILAYLRDAAEDGSPDIIDFGAYHFYDDLTEEEEALLCERENIFAIVQDRSMNVSARIRALCEKFDIGIPHRSFEEWIDTFLSLEIMDGAWKTLLCEAKEIGFLQEGDSSFEIAWEQLLLYFIYRHVSDPERDVREKIFFSVLGVSVIRSLFAYICKRDGKSEFDALVELCRLYSSEIEYSEENTEILTAMMEQGETV